MSTFERPSAYDGCTSKPAVGVAIFWPILCLEVLRIVQRLPIAFCEVGSLRAHGQASDNP